MVVDEELKKALSDLRALGVKRIVFRDSVYEAPREVEFFEPATAPLEVGELGEQEQGQATAEPEVPMGYLNAANAFKPKKRAG
jgi:hypothetical protein